MESNKQLIDVEKIIASDQFHAYIEAEIYKIKQYRHEIIKQNKRPRRGPFDYLLDNDMLNGEMIAFELKKIMLKQSKAPSDVRTYISALTWEPMQKAVKALKQ